ncbi:MAG: hypothetical protein AAF627_10030 [Myxococcota bacterium]
MQSIYELGPSKCSESLERRARRIHRLAAISSPPPWERQPSVQELSEELAALEQAVLGADASTRVEPRRTRAALELLRLFGRRLAKRLPETPADRTELNLRLRMEHRWCYAAAGTTRSDFDRATGRTGAR